jgi:hypothetical protein
MLLPFAPIFIIAVGLNYIWEVAQSPLFAAINNWDSIWWHCFVASLGDSIILCLIHAIGWAVFDRYDWYIDPGIKGYGLMLASGLVLAVAIEWGAVHIVQRWAYGVRMPVVPGLNIGLVPILQMLILPPLVFYFTRLWINRKKMSRHK